MSKFIDALPAEPLAREEALRAEANRLKDIEPAKFTKADVELTNEIVAELKRIKPSVDSALRAKSVGAALGGQGVRPAGSTTDPRDSGDGLSLHHVESGVGDPRQENVAGFIQAFKSAFKDASPVIGGFEARKALVPAGNVTVDYSAQIVRQVGAGVNTLSDLISIVQVDNPSGAYLQQTSRTNAAATVPIGEIKPQSAYGLDWATWKLATIAHMSESLPKQWLQDFSGLQDFIAAEMAYGVAQAIDLYALSGGSAEDGTAVTGLLNSGIVNVAYSTDALISLRGALTALDLTGVKTTGIVMHPTDWAAIEVMKDSTGRYLLPLAPQEQVARTLWGYPVVLSTGMTVGKALIGDFRYVNLLSKGSYEVTWAAIGTTGDPAETGLSADLYERNQVRFRAETRIGLTIQSKAALRTVALKSS